MRRIVMVVLLAGCSPPPAPEPVKAPAPVVAAVQPAPQAPAAPAPIVEAPKKKVKVTYESCQNRNAPFIQCGYKCMRRSRNMDGCVNACRPLLNREIGNKCLWEFGPGFT